MVSSCFHASGRIRLLLICPWISFSAPARAAGAADQVQTTPTRFFVLVGNNRSIEPEVTPLRYADDDAALYYQLFRPFAERIALLTVLDDNSQRHFPQLASIAEPPTKAALTRALEQTFAAIHRTQRRGDRAVELWFVFVGHGGLDGSGKGYVHLWDQRWTRADLFHQLIAASPADFTHVIIDACSAYSLVAGRGTSGRSPRRNNRGKQNGTPERFVRFLAGHDLADYPGVGVLTAASDNRETHEWSRIKAGVFSYQVRSALLGAADLNQDQQIEYSEVAAFVDAANAGLSQTGPDTATFAWPPARDRRRPLWRLRGAPEQRPIVLSATMSGRWYLESEHGDRWAELHAPGEHPIELWVPATLTFFLRNRHAEQEIPAGPNPFRIETNPHRALTLAERGATARELERKLFAIPMTHAFYLGFLSGHPELVSIDFASEAPAVEAAGSDIVITVNYGMGPALLVPQHIEHSAALALSFPLDFGWSVGPVIAVGHASAEKWRIDRGALLAQLSFATRFFERLRLEGGLGVGYEAVTLQGSSRSTDPLAGVARAQLSAQLRLFAGWWLSLGGAYAAHLWTIDDQEQIEAAPRATIGVTWTGGE